MTSPAMLASLAALGPSRSVAVLVLTLTIAIGPAAASANMHHPAFVP
jgi:hypothetical protein